MLSRSLFATVALGIACGSAAARTPDEAAEACRGLQGNRFETLEGAPTYIVRSTWRAATAAGTPSPTSPPNAAACVTEGYVNPTVKFGLLLPADGWNDKVMVRGCGGSCGEVYLDAACRHHVLNGYACLHSDMGHYSTLVDNVWAANNLQGLVDFGYRATHVSTVAGKAVTEAFYGDKPQRAYFFACSTGGRQGLVEAQRFPEDFDGIVAIAPASIAPFGDRRTEAQTNPDVINTGADGKPILPNRKALLIHQAVMQRCDLNDGLRDGIVGDPRQCKFDPAELQCKTADARHCLTAPQVQVVRRYYDEIGAERGSEFNWIGAWLRPAPLPGEVSKPLPWLARGRGDPALIETLNNANNPDLRAFKRRGGKLLLVQGWDDQSVLPRPTLDYYETMLRTMGGPAATRDFARLFMVPGMDHCSGGKGAYAIDYVKALEDWVERGRAPEALLGVHPLPGAPLDYFSTNLASLDAKWIEFTRLHPTWPESERMTPAKAPHNGLPRTPAPEPLAPLIGTQLKDSEAFARASAFPQATVAGHMMRTLWRSFFTRGIGADEAMAALESLPADSLSPTAREVVARMKVELGLD